MALEPFLRTFGLKCRGFFKIVEKLLKRYLRDARYVQHANIILWPCANNSAEP